MTKNYFWLNGYNILEKEALVPLATHSLHYASSVFEGIRCYNGKIFKLKEHMNRLFVSMDIMHLKIEINSEELYKACYSIIEENKINNAYIRVLVYRGAENLRIKHCDAIANIMILVVENNTVTSTKDSLELSVSAWRKAPPESFPYKAKTSGAYTNLIMSTLEASKEGYDDAILLDMDGYISEISNANIFFVTSEGGLHTPYAKTCLDGITRQTIFEIAKENNIVCIEKDIALDDLCQYKEAFVTGTAMEVKAVSYIDHSGRRYNFDNHITNKIKNIYYNKIGKTNV